MRLDNLTQGEGSVSPVPNSNPCLFAGSKGLGPGDSNERHLTTAHLMANLKGRTISSGFITMLSQGALFALNLGSATILARLLSPQDFGRVVMVTSIMAIFRIFREAGLSTATVQKEGITHAQVSNLFWINVGMSGMVTLMLAAFSPVIAWFYREPRLIGITLAISLTFLLSGLTVQHQALLNRQMRFKAIAAIQVGSMMVGVTVGILMAWHNYGHWALVGMALTTPCVALFLTWSASSWRPQLPRLRSGTRPLINFGFNLAIGDFIGSLARGSDGPMIGRIYGATSVGLYSRAGVLLVRPLDLFTYAIGSVFTPTLSRLQSDPDRYRNTFLQLYESIALLGSVFTSLVFVLAHPLTLVVLGKKWEEAWVIFAAFSVGAYCYLLTIACTWLFASQGRGKESMYSISFVSGLTALAYLFGLPFGPIGVAISSSIAGAIIHIPILFYTAGREGPVTMRDLMLGFVRYLPVWGWVWISTKIAYLAVSNYAPLEQVLFCIPIGLLAGGAFIALYPPSRGIALNLLLTFRSLSGTTAVAN